MLETGRYLYVVFLCHLSLEKILKAHVAEVIQNLPIKTHDLIYLVKTDVYCIKKSPVKRFFVITSLKITLQLIV